MEYNDLVTEWSALLGLAAMIAVLINVGKRAGVVKDGDAPAWSAGLNLVGLIALFSLKIFKPEMDIGEVDRQAGDLAEVAMVLIGYITQLLAAKATHAAVRNIPLIGTSFSDTETRRLAADSVGDAATVRDQMIYQNPRSERPWTR